MKQKVCLLIPMAKNKFLLSNNYKKDYIYFTLTQLC